MEIKINLDLPAIIEAAVSAERVQPLVDKAISEAIKDAIIDATNYRSAFREELKKQLSEAMPHGLSIADCVKFQQMFNLALSESVRSANAGAIQAAMRGAIKAAIPDVPEQIKLSELMKQVRYGLHKEDHEPFYADLEMSEYGGGWLSLDRNENCRDKYRASMRISFNKEGEVYALKLDERDLTPKSLPNAVGSFDGLLLAMYVGRTSLEIDMDESDVESAARPDLD